MNAVKAAIVLGAVLMIAKLSEDAAARLGLPAFLGAVLAGLVLGQAGLGVIDRVSLESIEVFLMLGINFTLFLAGSEELANPLLLKPSTTELVGSIACFAASTALTSLAAFYLLGLSLEHAIVLAAALSMSSLGPLAKIVLAESRESRHYALGLLRMGLLLELAGLVCFNAAFKGFSATTLAATVSLVVLVVVVGRRLLKDALYAMERRVAAYEAPFAVIVAMVITAGYMAEYLGFNSAVMALLLGLFASDYLRRRPAYLERLRALTYGFLEPLFFAGVGLNAAPLRPSHLVLAGVLMATHAVPKIVAARWALRAPLRACMALTAKGGVDAALLLTALSAGSLSQDVYSVGVASILFSVLASSLATKARRGGVELWRLSLGDVKLDKAIVLDEEPASYAAELVASKGAVVVVDRQLKPLGYLVAEDLIWVEPKVLDHIPARVFARRGVTCVGVDALLADVVADYTLLLEPIVAVVDKDGRVVGTFKPLQLLEYSVAPAPELRG